MVSTVNADANRKTHARLNSNGRFIEDPKELGGISATCLNCSAGYDAPQLPTVCP
jgi:hypothetical protein